MQVEGGCQCGKITYRAVVDPERATLCHCTDCQAMTGSPYRASVPANAGTFEILAGKPKIYVKRTSESGTPRAHGFCGDCGSPLYATSVENPQIYNLRIGNMKQRALLAPRRQIWCRSALPWSADIGALPKNEKQ